MQSHTEGNCIGKMNNGNIKQKTKHKQRIKYAVTRTKYQQILQIANFQISWMSKLWRVGGLLYGKTHITACKKKKTSSFANKQTKGEFSSPLEIACIHYTTLHTHTANPTTHKQHTKAPKTHTHIASRSSHQIHPSGGSRHIQHRPRLTKKYNRIYQCKLNASMHNMHTCMHPHKSIHWRINVIKL